jgi:endonuclease IV
MIRVRKALEDSTLRQKLRFKLPPKEYIKLPDDLKHTYPQSIIKLLPNTYTDFGIVTEILLRGPVTSARLAELAQIPQKTLNLASTRKYLENVETTHQLLLGLIGDETPIYDHEIRYDGCNIIGHPDITTSTQIFEVKTSGKLKESWLSFLLQTFAYAALCPHVKKVHIVLPLQAIVWSLDLTPKSWPKRQPFLEVLQSVQAIENTVIQDNMEFAASLFERFPIGYHVAKAKSIAGTIGLLEDNRRPYQMFLTRTTNVKLSSTDVMIGRAMVEDTGIKMFVHAPYLLNLCIEPFTKDDYVLKCLEVHLTASANAGLKGVVVHVGKQCQMEKATAIENMKQNILRAIEFATPQCPLILETPSGQGSELLTTIQEFMDFIQFINSDKLGICVDTCHVFASGQMPTEYLTTLIEKPEWRNRIKLIHFNDSLTKLGGCTDRHASIGFGLIPKSELLQCATLAHTYNIPMLTE